LTEMSPQFRGLGLPGTINEVRLRAGCNVGLATMSSKDSEIVSASSHSPSSLTLRKALFTDEKRVRLTEMSISIQRRGVQASITVVKLRAGCNVGIATMSGEDTNNGFDRLKCPLNAAAWGPRYNNCGAAPRRLQRRTCYNVG
jgi:hypothetical protein